MAGDPFADFDGKAIAPMLEPLTWRQDAAPHTSATINGVVLQGQQETASAGLAIDNLTADSWVVHCPINTITVSKISTGDTITRGMWRDKTLNVQSVMRSESGWWIVCTINERPRRN